MKVAVSSLDTDLNSAVDLRFGRTRYFLIVDLETMEFESVPNPNIDATGGAGIQSAQLMGNKGVEAIITGQVGPNAFQTLSAIGVRIHQAMGGTVRQAIEAYKTGQLPSVSQPGPSHAGIGPHMAPGSGGIGIGGGMRPGRVGAGRGRRGGMGGGFGAWQAGLGFWGGQTQSAAPHMSKDQEIQALKQQAETLGKQLEEINRRLQELDLKNEEKK